MKSGWGTNLGPQWTPSTFGADPGFFFFYVLSLTLRNRTFSVISQRIMMKKKKQTYLGAGIYE